MKSFFRSLPNDSKGRAIESLPSSGSLAFIRIPDPRLSRNAMLCSVAFIARLANTVCRPRLKGCRARLYCSL